MAIVARILAALLVLMAALAHALAPAVKMTSLFGDKIYSMLAGADPLITAYVDTGWWPVLALLTACLCLFGAVAGTLKGERWAASLVMLAAFADALSLYLANEMGYTSLPLGPLQITGLGLGMVALWLLVRSVTKRV